MAAPDMTGPTWSRRRPSRSAQSEAALLAAIERHLRSRTLAELNIAEVAQAAGLGRSAFYSYFANREAAVAALLSGLFDDITARASALLAAPTVTPTALREALAATVDVWADHRHLFVAMADSVADPAVRGLWESWLDRFVDVVVGLDAARTHGPGEPVGPAFARVARALIMMNERILEDWARRGAPATERTAVLDTLAFVWQRCLLPEQS